MYTKCEVCRMGNEVPDAELERHIVHFRCTGCRTSYWATRTACRRVPRSTRPPPLRRRPPALAASDAGERLDDLHAIARQSTLPPPPPLPAEELVDAPASVRHAIRTSLPPSPLAVTTTPLPEAVTLEPVADPARPIRRVHVGLGAVIAGVAVVLAVDAHDRATPQSATAVTGVAQAALVDTGAVISAATLVSPRATETPHPPPAKAAPRPPARVAAAAPPTPPQQQAPQAPPMSLQEAMVAAAGKQPAH